MEFEEKLNEMYQEIANKINEMIPVEWDKVYTKAYIKEESKEVFSTILYLVVMNYITILLFLKNIMFQKNYLKNYWTSFTKILKASESYL
ncbi:YezG-like immunity protein [Staphylococcus epidermidis]